MADVETSESGRSYGLLTNNHGVVSLEAVEAHQSEIVAHLTAENALLYQENAEQRERIGRLEDDNRSLRDENAVLREDNIALREGVARDFTTRWDATPLRRPRRTRTSREIPPRSKHAEERAEIPVPLSVSRLGGSILEPPDVVFMGHVRTLPPPQVLVGRDSELRRVVQYLTASKPGSWLTLTGGVGIGKSAIAVEAARRWAIDSGARALFVPMGQIETRAQLHSAFTHALQLGTPETIRSDRPVELLINDHLLDRRTTLILDGCEGLPEGRVLDLLRLLESGSRVVATSYRSVGVANELVQRVEPLDDHHAAELLLYLIASGSRKAPVTNHSGFSLLVKLCGGVPRVLQVASAQADTRPLEEVCAEFELGQGPSQEEGLPWLLDTALTRISSGARETFYQLSIFEGSFSADDAESVLSDRNDVAAYLAELEFGGLLLESEGRYQMHFAFRPVAASRVPLERASALECGYVRHFGAVAERYRTDLGKIGLHLANIQKALALAFANSSEFFAEAAQIATSLPTYWANNRGLDVAVQTLGQVASLAEFDALTLGVRVTVLGNWGAMLLSSGNYSETANALKRALPLAKEDGNPLKVAAIASNLAVALMRLDRELESLPYHDEAVVASRALGDTERLALALVNASAAHIVAKSYEDALALSNEATALLPNGPVSLRCQLNAAEALYGLGRTAESVTLARDLAQLGLMQDQLTVAAHCLWLVGIAKSDKASIQNAINYLQSAGDGPTTFALRKMAEQNFNVTALSVPIESSADSLRISILAL